MKKEKGTITMGDRKKGAELFNSIKQEHSCINIIEFRREKWEILKITILIIFYKDGRRNKTVHN